MVRWTGVSLVVLVCAQPGWSATNQKDVTRAGGAGRLASVVEGYSTSATKPARRQATAGVAYVQLDSPQEAPAAPPATEPTDVAPGTAAEATPAHIVPAPKPSTGTPYPPRLTTDTLSSGDLASDMCGEGCGLVGPGGWSECCDTASCRVSRWREGRLFRENGFVAWLLGPEIAAAEMPQHQPYRAQETYYYFRPYNAVHIRQLQSAAIRDVDADPRLPWSTAPFDALYQNFEQSERERSSIPADPVPPPNPGDAQ